MKVIIYYSLQGNCEYVANEIAKDLGIQAVRLVPEIEPPKKGFGMFFKGGGMVVKKKKPALVDFNLKLEDYDTIILCAPVWAGMYPPAVRTFLSDYDLSGKKLAIVASSAGGDARKMMDAVAADSRADVIGRLSLVLPLRKQDEAGKIISEFCWSLE
ncbi:MAG: NAD(P)H-dependent oxidoreductase [Spirochaetales bacterium]|nr:NAD(P)H-dependent oxidoreductase [Spirochaetales bacterium]